MRICKNCGAEALPVEAQRGLTCHDCYLKKQRRFTRERAEGKDLARRWATMPWKPVSESPESSSQT